MNRIAQIAKQQCEAAVVANYAEGFLNFTPVSFTNGKFFAGNVEAHGFLWQRS